MAFGTSGWLTALLEAEVAQHRPVTVAPEGQRLRGAARAHVRTVLQDSGLLYGTPEHFEAADSSAPEEQLFLAMLRTLVQLALDLADISEAPRAGRLARLNVLFAAWTGQLVLADELQRLPRGAPSGKLLSRLESQLERRAMSVGGDPVYGLLLHNGAAYVDAQLFSHLALEAWMQGSVALDRVKRRLAVAAQQKALLVEVLIALACAERPPGYAARRAILRQVEDLGLPKPLGGLLRQRVRTVFDERPDLDLLVRPVRSRRLRRFILEQTVLASLVEGRPPSEVAFLRALARALRISPEGLREIEAEVAEFYAEHRSILDVFTVSAHAATLADELVGGMQRSLDKNMQALLLEARMMGELSVFLGKLAMGQSLTADERHRMRQELLDVAKAIPTLAIFAAPGGLLLLAALAKLLPFSLLPSAFHQPPRSEERSLPPS